MSDEHLELTHIWKDQSGNVVAKLYGGVSLIPEIAKRQARIEELEARLRDIGYIAHAQSTGPAEVDWLWRIRELAYELL